MSDYQSACITSIEGSTLTIEVTEVHPDVNALGSITEEGRVREIQTDEALNFAAILLLEYDGRGGQLVDVAADMDPLEPGRLVSNVRVGAMEPVGQSSQGTPLYKATLDVTLTRRSYAGMFSIGEEWGAAALPTGDLDDCLT